MTTFPALKKWAASPAAYALLDSYIPGATSWCAGGCAPLAFALYALLPDATFAGVEQTSTVHHLGVLQHGRFVDCRGGRLLASVQRYWATELGGNTKITKLSEQDAFTLMQEYETSVPGLVAAVQNSLIQNGVI